MEAILLEYAWVLVVLIVLEGLLAADNAVVMAVMVKHLPKINSKSIAIWFSGSICFRFAALFLITTLVNFWQIQALGAAYLLIMSTKHIYDSRKAKQNPEETQDNKNNLASG